MDLLCIPSNAGSLRLVQWPLFLLSSKVELIMQYYLLGIDSHLQFSRFPNAI